MLPRLMAPRVSSSSRVVALAGLCISVGFAWLAVRHLDVRAIGEVLRKTALFPWVAAAVACYLAGHGVRGQRLRLLLRREANMELATASNVVVVGYASNNVLPARLGELVRAGMLAERTGMPLAQTLTITFIERLLDGVAILFLLVISTFASHSDDTDWIHQLAKVGALVFGAAILVLTIATMAPRLVVRIAGRVARPLGRRAYQRALSLATSIVNATASLRDPREALVLGLMSLLVWSLEAMMFVCVLPALGLPFHVSLGVTAMSVTNLGILVPSTPGFIGPFHYFCSQALIANGIEPTVALAYATLVHLAFFIPVTVWGTGAMLWYGVQLGETAARVRAARSSPRTKEVDGVLVHVIAPAARAPAAVTPSAFDRALTEAVLPHSMAGATELVDDVATFFAGEMAALPTRIRWLYHFGMFGFRVYVRLRHVRSFCALPVVTRRRAVDVWAFGPVTPMRQLFRPVRSTVLLAGFEHVSGGTGTKRSLPTIQDGTP